MTVEKTDFISFLHHYSESSADEAEKLLSLKSEYPYSQLLHTLAARVTKDHGLTNHQEMLQAAAVHAADRSVLKDIIMAAPCQASKEEQPAVAALKSGVAPSAESDTPQPETHTTIIKSIDTVDVADEVIRDLETLNTSRHNFEMLFVEYSEVTANSTAAEQSVGAKEKAGQTQDNSHTQESFNSEKTQSLKNEPQKAKDKKSKKARIIEIARAMNATEHFATSDTSELKNKKVKSVRQPEELIEEIESTKREITPENEKQKEQIALINQFIKTQPSISSARERQISSPSADLIPIKSGEFGDNIVSETLVEILVKQGKKDKAIEVLKKLIWKYPQKKAYFASQIEDLKK